MPELRKLTWGMKKYLKETEKDSPALIRKSKFCVLRAKRDFRRGVFSSYRGLAERYGGVVIDIQKRGYYEVVK